MKPTRTWIVIANGSRAHIVLNEGVGKGLHLIPGLDFSVSHEADRDIQADRPGRTFDRIGPGRHAMEATSSPHRMQKAHFAQTLAALLDEKLGNKAFDRLIIAAPAKTLGDLRKEYSTAVRACVVSELDKDLTNIPTNKLESHLDSVLVL